MPIRTMLLASALVFGSLSSIRAADAGDTYGGFGPSETDTQEIGSDPATGGPTPDDNQNMESTQQQIQDQKDTYDSDGSQQGAVDGGTAVDDESGH